MPVNRRDFFRLSFHKATDLALQGVEARVAAKAQRWIRPPFARPELDFLLACTRCGACIEACPHAVLFPLPSRLGLEVAGTPAMDLVNRACRLCDDWPCVAACAPGALTVAGEPAPTGSGEGEMSAGDASGDSDGDGGSGPRLPRLALAGIDTQACLPYAGPECGACDGFCPVPGALLWDGPRPRIDAAVCVGCGQCRAACIADPKAIVIRPLPQAVRTSPAEPREGEPAERAR